MALVRCPECGKENVSNTAKACPNCGFNINEHFICIAEKDKEQKAEEEYERSERIRLKNRNKSIIDSISMPEEPKISKIGIGFSVFLIAFAILSFYWWQDYNYLNDNQLYTAIGCVVVSIIVFLITLKSFYSSKANYKIICSNFEEYKTHRVTELIEAADRREKAQIEAMIASKNNHSVKCPICGSYNTKRISNMNRIVSISAVGLASSKIGKQYECAKCKHKW